ncbi:MAG TPA: hypothetical protein DCM68_00855 [Verrucomicrobia bacterium]|nr:hypothetical protein [Verrucomicrobiota bacterium]
MTIARHFHGWTTSSLPAAVEILTRGWKGQGPIDLRDSLIVVPTRHAGRRLRAELARIAAQKGTAVLTNSIVTPEHLVPLPPGVANDSLVLALLARRLLGQHEKLPTLFPAKGTQWDFTFALGLAAQLQDVRRQLNEADRSAADIVSLVPEEERDRWSEIAQLEKGLVQDISRLGLKDPLVARREAARRPADPAPYSRIIALFVPDLPALAVRMLQAMSATGSVELHILAPESEAARFDEWGRPLPDRWENEPLPLDDRQIHVFEQAPDETEALASLLIQANHHKQALTVCTPDPGNAQALARRLQIDGLSLYLPNGVPIASTAPGRLLSAWLALLRQRDYASTAAFLRHPDAQDWLGIRLELEDANALLSQLDQCQTKHLPTAFDDLLRFAKQGKGYPVLARSLEELKKHFADSVPVFLADLYDCRKPSSALPPDPLFAEAAKSLADLVQTTGESAQVLGLDREDSIDLLRTAMATEMVFPKPNPSAAGETIGWLEVQWETSPAVLLADMREGIVPETRIGDAFLPDSLRAKAGIAGNREWFARDLFLARTLLASHPPEGVRFLYSRRAANQDPQLPSRILLACPDNELPKRVELMFGRPGLRATADAAPASPILPIVPPACKPERIPKSLSVTAFKAYLACPFRFYLAQVLGMKSEDDSAREIDIMEFGTLAHDALRILKKHEALDDEAEIQSLLLAELDRLAQTQFGPRPSFAAIVQLESLRQRLSAAAKIHAAAVREGWRIISAEEKFEAELDGMILRARIDRIDRHLESGRIRILDYKTSDGGESPIKTHFRPNSEERWVDLQLPLYRFIYEQLHLRASRSLPPCAAGEQKSASGDARSPGGAIIAVGYFNLPKATGKTGIVEMDLRGKAGEDLYADAIAKAREVIAGIQAGQFWPPTDKAIRFDDFEPLFAGGGSLIREPGKP